MSLSLPWGGIDTEQFHRLRDVGSCQRLAIDRQQPKFLQDRLLDGIGPNALGRTVGMTPLLGMCADVVAMLTMTPVGDAVDHGRIAGHAPQEPLQQRAVLVTNDGTLGPGVTIQDLPNTIPGVLFDDRLVLTLVDFFVVAHLPQVEHVGQQVIDVALVEGLPSPGLLDMPGL